jgi:ArsR family transcriptional regulator
MLDVTAVDGCRRPSSSAPALRPETAAALAPMFKALGDPVRLRLLSLIASTVEICVCDLTGAFEVTGATISHHLRVLREAGMIDGERRGPWVYYRIKQAALDQLGGLLRAGVRADGGVEHQRVLISGDPDVVRLLADPLRARIVEILASGPACTSHLVADTGAKQPNVSGHLRQLREAGVVTTEPRGRLTYYRLVPDVLRGAAGGLAELAAQARTNHENFRTA